MSGWYNLYPNTLPHWFHIASIPTALQIIPAYGLAFPCSLQWALKPAPYSASVVYQCSGCGRLSFLPALAEPHQSLGLWKWFSPSLFLSSVRTCSNSTTESFSRPCISAGTGIWVGIFDFGLLVIAATITVGLYWFPLLFWITIPDGIRPAHFRKRDLSLHGKYPLVWFFFLP